MTQDSSLAAASLNPRGRGVLVSHHRPPGRNLSDTTSDRGLDKAPLDKISGVSKPLSQQFPDPLLSSGECWVGGEMHSAPPPDNGACTCRFLGGYGLGVPSMQGGEQLFHVIPVGSFLSAEPSAVMPMAAHAGQSDNNIERDICVRRTHPGRRIHSRRAALQRITLSKPGCLLCLEI